MPLYIFSEKASGGSCSAWHNFFNRYYLREKLPTHPHMNLLTNDWKLTDTQVFWGEIAPCNHVVQIYEDDRVFLDLLTGFVTGGINAGECVIIIATAAHLTALNERLREEQYNVFALKLSDQLIFLNAEEALNSFMVNDWPDEILFRHLVSGLVSKAKLRNRKVRAFGEMVALLWAQGHNGATVQLEHLWNKFCGTEAFTLFCAYPRSGFTQDPHTSVLNICGAHSKMVAGVGQSKTEIFYKNLEGVEATKNIAI
jgi:hypothetical protein